MATDEIRPAPAVPALRILGPLEIWTEDTQHPVPPGRREIVLASLLLAANQVVSLDTLVDAIWYDDPPATARTQVQICVSGLRTSLSTIGLPIVIVTRTPGYLMQVPPGWLDIQVFSSLVADAQNLIRNNEPQDAARHLRTAIGLWRGSALAGTSSRVLQTKGLQLDEKRLAAVETYADLELRLGRHHQLISEIGTLVNEYPLRERLRGQLMLALYRAGRQAEALDTYRIGRDQLVDQVGLEPSTELRQLQRAILTGGEGLRLETDKPSPSAAAERGVRPFQLPADIADFTGRTEQIDAIQRRLVAGDNQRAVRVVMVTGSPGVGKSALAVHIGHRMIDEHFPDGQLYANLGGTTSEHACPTEVLGRFLRALGLPGAAIPEHAEERAELYRHLLSRKRMLVVLDDADASVQLRLLLPGSNSCAVIVTSRGRPRGLPGAWVTTIDVMDDPAALELLGKVVGEERVAAEPDAAGTLVRLVGGLPLALRVVAARLAGRPHWTLSGMVGRLADERSRLDELAHGEMIVRASLAMSYDGLDPATRRLFRLVGAINSDGFPAWAAAALVDGDVDQTTELLERLVDVHLLEIASIDRDGNPHFRMHAIIRLFARERLAATEQPGVIHSGMCRMIGGWLRLTTEAHRRVYGGDYTVLHGTAATWEPPRSYLATALADPLGWLEAARSNLSEAVQQAAELGLDELCWDLAVSLVVIFEARSYLAEWEFTHLRALEVTRAKGNSRGTAALMCSLGSLYLSRNRTAAAEDVLLPALATFEELGDPHGRAMTVRNLAFLDLARGQVDRAAERYRSALADFAIVGDRIGHAHVLSQIGHIELISGAPEAAESHLKEALALCEKVGSRRVEVQVRYRLCELMVDQGRLAAAAEVLAELLQVARAGRDVVGEGRILHRLGVVNAALGRAVEAEAAYREALAVHEQIMDRAGVAAVSGDLKSLLG
ncbi:MAG TPA: BTAD domain-containing putative transcriptional regulator [Actinokineospora sp.]|nr:BTAD domain-containing putative transcriptional regulator [Actinokineospora sp.]